MLESHLPQHKNNFEQYRKRTNEEQMNEKQRQIHRSNNEYAGKYDSESANTELTLSFLTVFFGALFTPHRPPPDTALTTKLPLLHNAHPRFLLLRIPDSFP